MSKKNSARHLPPAISENLLRLLLPAGIVGESILGDTREEYHLYAEAHGKFRAKLWYWINASKIARHFITGRKKESRQAPPPSSKLSSNRGGGFVASTAMDVRYAVRQLLLNPGFTGAAVVTLALGIGANTAIFSVVHAVLLKQLPFHEPDRIVRVYQSGMDGSRQRFSVTPGNFHDWKDQSQSLESLTAFTSISGSLVGTGEPEMLNGIVSYDGSIFDVLKVPALIGRAFTAEAADPSADNVIVLGYSAWQRLFGLNTDIVGETVSLSGTPFTLLGVMPPDFRFPNSRADFWVATPFTEPFKSSRASDVLLVVARLAPRQTLESATAEMETIMAPLRELYPSWNDNVKADVVPLHDQVTDGVQARLWILLGAVGFVLLIACSNLASMLLARASGREREIALRGALGASRWRITRQLLIESVVLSAVGGTAGLVVGSGLLRVLRVLTAESVPRWEEVGIDGNVLGFTLIISIVAGLFFGTFPAIQLARRSSAEVLRAGSRGGGGGGVRRGWGRQVLVVSEIAMALILLAGSGLLIRSFVLLQAIDPGVRVEGVLTFSIGAPVASYPNAPDRYNFFQQAVERIGDVPGVHSAALINRLPVTGRGFGSWFRVQGRFYAPGDKLPSVRTRTVSPNYFETVGIPLVSGRVLGSQDRPDGVVGVVVNQTLARIHWPNESAVGKAVLLGSPGSLILPPATVVGVVRDVENSGLGGVDEPVLYFSHALRPWRTSFSFAVHTAVDPMSVMGSIRDAIRKIDSALPINDVRTMTEVIAETVTPQRSSMILLGIFAGVALIMAAVGVFGVLSYSVAQRERELGIRVALGADRATVRWMVVKQGLTQALAGIGIGLIGAYLLTGLMKGMLFGISANDPVTFAGVAGILAMVATVASYLPARRATKADPMIALRAE